MSHQDPHNSAGEPRIIESKRVNAMFSSIAPNYDLTNTVLSFGIDRLWRKRLSKLIPYTEDHGRMILDLCTGTGVLLPDLRARGGIVLGADFCFPMLQRAPRQVASLLAQGDALNLPFCDGVFDYVSVAFGVRNFEDRVRGLREIGRILKPDGKLLVLDFGKPGRLIEPFFRFYSDHLMPCIGGIITGNRSAYEYLPQTSKEFPARESFIELAISAGFSGGRYWSLTGGIAYLYELQRGGAA